MLNREHAEKAAHYASRGAAGELAVRVARGRAAIYERAASRSWMRGRTGADIDRAELLLALGIALRDAAEWRAAWRNLMQALELFRQRADPRRTRSHRACDRSGSPRRTASRGCSRRPPAGVERHRRVILGRVDRRLRDRRFDSAPDVPRVVSLPDEVTPQSPQARPSYAEGRGFDDPERLARLAHDQPR